MDAVLHVDEPMPESAPATQPVDEDCADTKPANQTSWLARFPNTAYAIVLALAGNSILWKIMSSVPFSKHVGTTGNWVFWIAGLSMLGIVSLTMAVKTLYPTTRPVVYAEWCHPLRRYFFVGPHVGTIMLAIGAPDRVFFKPTARIIFGVTFGIQFLLSLKLYRDWMYSEAGHLQRAGTQYLLSIVGWLLLTKLGQVSGLKDQWGLDFEAFCFGTGVAFYLVVITPIFLGMKHGHNPRGHPALWLLIAPPAIASIDLEVFTSSYNTAATATLGFCLIMFAVLIASGPKFLAKPEALGVDWAVCFPVAAMTTSMVLYAKAEDTEEAKVLAWALIGIDTAAVGLVCLRTIWSQLSVLRGKECWRDPLVEMMHMPVSSSEAPKTCMQPPQMDSRCQSDASLESDQF